MHGWEQATDRWPIDPPETDAGDELPPCCEKPGCTQFVVSKADIRSYFEQATIDE